MELDSTSGVAPEDDTMLSGAMVRGEGALTMTGTILGTPAYMAPEQWRAGQVSAYSDQFSYCVALFEALYGYRPFAGKTIAHLRENLETGRVAARPRDTEVPRWVHAVLLRGLSIEASDRWPSMRELLDVLARDPRVRRRRVGVGTLAIAFAGALIHAVIPTSEPTSEPEIN